MTAAPGGRTGLHSPINWVAALKVPFFVTTLGKGAVTEDNPLYGGAYAGMGSYPEVAKAVESTDCVLWLGNIPSDFNT